MAYNPNHLVPPDNPNAIWCEYCGDQIGFEEIDECHERVGGGFIHMECLSDYCTGLEMQMKHTNDAIEKMIERGLT